MQSLSYVLEGIAANGTLPDALKSKQVLQQIAANSLLYKDVISKLGLLEITDVAWRQDRCGWDSGSTDSPSGTSSE